MRVSLSLSFAILAASLAAQSPPPPVLDNDQVRVVVAAIAPGATASPPQGSWNRLAIFLDPGLEKPGGGRARTGKVEAGDIRWSPAASPSAIGNAGAAPLRVVQVDLKGEGKAVRFGDLDPVRLAPASYRVLMENQQVRVLRARIGAKQSVPFHEHALNRVVVYLSDAHLRITGERGDVTESKGAAGDIRWAGLSKHAETNLAASAFDVLVVEVK
jgi:hypothetical protein